MLLRLALVGAILLGTSCFTMRRPPVIVSWIEFPAAEYGAFDAKGTGVVRGQAFLKTRGGDVKLAAGEEITLNPVTSYSEQWHDVSYKGRKRMNDPDPRYETYVRKTIADADGRFTFSDLPAGDYFVLASVFWEAATGHKGALQRHGSRILKRISVAEGQQLEVIVTR